MILAKSGLDNFAFYKWYPFFYTPTLVEVPKILSNALNADEVQIQNLPNYPPGAN